MGTTALTGALPPGLSQAAAEVAPLPVWGSSGSIASPGKAGAPLCPGAKVRTRSKDGANRVANNSKADRASSVALCTTAVGKPKRLSYRFFEFAGYVAAHS